MKNKRVLFGTDGVRDVANRGGMTPEMALRLGRVFILFLAERGVPRPRIVLGRDTRRSGMMLEGALSAGMTSAGAEVLSAGIIPTPGVSYAVQHLAADGGAVISASHNPAEYNGIKFLDRNGCKLSDGSELAIEDLDRAEKTPCSSRRFPAILPRCNRRRRSINTRTKVADRKSVV